MSRPIQLVEVRTNNLKNISCEIPRGKVVLVIGPSGSGKSSLVLGTLLAEAERRVVAPLVGRVRSLGAASSRATAVSGLSYPVAFYSGRDGAGRLATVSSASGLATLLEELFYTAGVRHCMNCGTDLPAISANELLDSIANEPKDVVIWILAALPADETGRSAAIKGALAAGYSRGVAGDEAVELERLVSSGSLWKDSPWFVFIDAVPLAAKGWRERSRGGMALAEKLGGGAILRLLSGGSAMRELFYSDSPQCPRCGVKQEKLERASFSYSRRKGRCPECLGAGLLLYFNEKELVDELPPLLEGGILPWRKRPLRPPDAVCESWAAKLKLKKGVRWDDLDERKRGLVLFGTAGVNRYSVAGPRGLTAQKCLETHGLCGQLLSSSRERGYALSPELTAEIECSLCRGSRLRREAGLTTVGRKSFAEVMSEPIGSLLDWRPDEPRLKLLADFGLSYLSLGRAVRTLSAGELQRVELARELGSSGHGLLYLLDEPSAGLHPQDLARVIAEARTLGREDSALLITDHHEQVIAAADHVLELGPGGGGRGGELVFEGSIEAFRERQSGRAKKSNARVRVDPSGRPRLSAHGMNARNLKHLSLRIPLRALVGICGVSGSGKSTALFDSLGPAVREAIARRRTASESPELPQLGISQLSVPEEIRRVEMLDRLRFGGRIRSDVGAMLGIWPVLERLFAMAPEARLKGLTSADFRRRNLSRSAETAPESLEIAWRGLKFKHVIRSTVEELAELFARIPRLGEPLRQLVDFDLGYLNVSQLAATLSSGERQRLRLAARTARRGGGTLYLLDEPARGLDAGEVHSVLRLFQRLIDEGHTVVFIEHRPLILAQADYLIELGPGAGEAGGRIIAEGTPDELKRSGTSLIAPYLE